MNADPVAVCRDRRLAHAEYMLKLPYGPVPGE